LTWKKARENFDGYQGKPEPKTTQLAQYKGFLIGRKIFQSEEKRKLNNPGHCCPKRLESQKSP
jgi:hypothetical protein